MKTLFKSPSHRHHSALSLVEVVLVVGALAILSAIGAASWSAVNRNAQRQKLETDVRTLNSALTVYLSSGGNLAGATEPGGVLARLKTSRSKGDRRLHAAAGSGRLVDARVAAVAVPASSWKSRAVFNAAKQRFEVASSGNGVEFILDPTIAEVAATIENRDLGAVKYSSTSSWVWDHSPTVNPSAPAGPSVFPTNPSIADSSPIVAPAPAPAPAPPAATGPSTPPPPPPPPLPRLPTPQFSLAGGAHSELLFPLSVTITNVPSGDIASVIFQVGSGPWTAYSGAVPVPMNSWLRAQFIAKDPATYQDGSPHSAYYYPVPESLSGTVNGDFHSATGGPNLLHQITSDGDRFAHGDPVFILDGQPVNSGEPNVLAFASQPFSNVPPGQKFKLGDLIYNNGSTYYDSHATGVKLRMTITLPERFQTISFDLNLELVNTENDPDDAHASADYVVITNLAQDVPLQINGVNYRILLEFGATDSFGFSSKSQFHVYEGAAGQGEILGTFLPR